MGLFVRDGRLRPGWVLLVFGAVAAAAMGALAVPLALLDLLPHPGTPLDDPRVLANSLLVFAGAAVATLVCAGLLKAEVGLRDARAGARLGLGAAMGAGAVAVSVGLPALLGHGALHPSAASLGVTLASGALQFLFLAPTGVGEELLVRGVPLRELSRGTRPWAAVLLTGAAFGLLHLGNPEASWVSTFNVALVGWWFGALVVRTGSLWTGIGLHLAWNFCEGWVFGMPVSGVRPGHALLAASWESRGFWSGGEFGPEASGITVVVLAVGLALTVLLPRRRAEGGGGPGGAAGGAGAGGEPRS